VCEREESDFNIIQKTSEEIQRLNNLLQVESKNREETEQAIYDMLRDVVSRVKTEMEQERNNR
jgi:hypothetical protein